MFRRIVDTARKAMGLPVTHHFPDPVMRMPHSKPTRAKHFSRGKHRYRDVTKPQIPCVPGTITFHDKCVKYYGRRKAEQIRRDFQHKDQFGHHDRLDRMPTEANFAALKPWAWRSQ